MKTILTIIASAALAGCVCPTGAGYYGGNYAVSASYYPAAFKFNYDAGCRYYSAPRRVWVPTAYEGRTGRPVAYGAVPCY